MSKQALYYSDSYLKEIESTVTGKIVDDNDIWITLDQTIFYPGGGGQLSDSGFIGSCRVIEVKEEDSLIWHKVDSSGSIESGEKVMIRIDWDRRYYNMQQHTGQHLLSTVMGENGMTTVSVHLGEEYTLIEADGRFPGDRDILQIETLANARIQESIPVKIHWVDKSQANKFPLRKIPAKNDNLRIVEIENLDYSGCGGTHVRNTAEVGLIKLTGVEKIRGRARIKALCGQKAYEYFNNLHEMQVKLKQSLQTDFSLFPERVKALSEERMNLEKEKNNYRKRFLQSLAGKLFYEHERRDHALVRSLEHCSVEDAADVAKILANEYGATALIFSENRFFFVAPADSERDLRGFLKFIPSSYGLRGGGSPTFVQGVATFIDLKSMALIVEQFLAKTNN